MLIVAGYIEISREVRRGVTDIAGTAALVERIVHPIAVGLESLSVERRGPWPRIGRDRSVAQALVERSRAAFRPYRHRRASDPGLGNDVDDPADGIVAIEHGAAVAPGYFRCVRSNRAESWKDPRLAGRGH